VSETLEQGLKLSGGRERAEEGEWRGEELDWMDL